MSHDGAYAVVVIAMLGNPFSPAYARARALSGGLASPLAYTAMNVALYGPGFSRRWCLTERAVAASALREGSVTLGRSTMAWDRGALRVDLDELSSPFRRRVRGRITLTPTSETGSALGLDAAGDHLWWPVAPRGATGHHR